MQPTGKVRRREEEEEDEKRRSFQHVRHAEHWRAARAGTRTGCSHLLLPDARRLFLLLLLFHRFKRLGLFSSILSFFLFFFFLLLRRKCAVVPLMVYGRHSRVSVVSWRRVTFFYKKKKKKKRPRRVRSFARSLASWWIDSLSFAMQSSNNRKKKRRGRVHYIIYRLNRCCCCLLNASLCEKRKERNCHCLELSNR